MKSTDTFFANFLTEKTFDNLKSVVSQKPFDSSDQVLYIVQTNNECFRIISISSEKDDIEEEAGFYKGNILVYSLF